MVKLLHNAVALMGAGDVLVGAVGQLCEVKDTLYH
jgi:hypothetical protein